MKKDLIFTPVMLLVGVLLFLLKTTGMTAHIVISVVGVLALIVYTVLTKKDWKIPALEILMMNVRGIVALAVIHKVSAVLFLALLVVLFVSKAVSSKKVQ